MFGLRDWQRLGGENYGGLGYPPFNKKLEGFIESCIGISLYNSLQNPPKTTFFIPWGIGMNKKRWGIRDINDFIMEGPYCMKESWILVEFTINFFKKIKWWQFILSPFVWIKGLGREMLWRTGLSHI